MRLQDGSRRGYGEQMKPNDNTTTLREDRDADDRALDAKGDAQSDDPDAAGAALLARLGLPEIND